MTTTGILMVATFITLAIYDAIVVMRQGVGCSISRFLQRTALRAPVFTFSVGFVAGHIFGYMAPEPVVFKNELMVRPSENDNEPTIITVPHGMLFKFEPQE